MNKKQVEVVGFSSLFLAIVVVASASAVAVAAISKSISPGPIASAPSENTAKGIAVTTSTDPGWIQQGNKYLKIKNAFQVRVTSPANFVFSGLTSVLAENSTASSTPASDPSVYSQNATTTLYLFRDDGTPQAPRYTLVAMKKDVPLPRYKQADGSFTPYIVETSMKFSPQRILTPRGTMETTKKFYIAVDQSALYSQSEQYGFYGILKAGSLGRGLPLTDLSINRYR